MGRTLNIWLKAVRPNFFTATFIPVTLGGVLAWHQFSRFNWPYFLLTLVGALFIHAGLDLANDYFDHISGNDEINRFPTPFSGGSRVIQKGILSPRQVLGGAIICFFMASAIGLFLNYLVPGNVILALGIIGIVLAFFYGAPPLRIGYKGLGELACGLGFGPIMVLGSYFVQTGRFTWLPVFVSVPVGILIVSVLYINEFPDYEADKAVNKRTLVVILGKRKALVLYHFLLGAAYLWTILGVTLRFMPPSALITLGTLPLAFKALKVAAKEYENVYALLPANAATIGLHLSFGLLLIASYLIPKIVWA